MDLVDIAERQARAARIRRLNDNFRRTFIGGRVMLTPGVQERRDVQTILRRVRKFKDFTKENDPYNEHDFGAFEQGGAKFFFKLDCYDKSLEAGSEDPADPAKTARVLTIMLAEEY